MKRNTAREWPSRRGEGQNLRLRAIMFRLTRADNARSSATRDRSRRVCRGFHESLQDSPKRDSRALYGSGWPIRWCCIRSVRYYYVISIIYFISEMVNERTHAINDRYDVPLVIVCPKGAFVQLLGQGCCCFDLPRLRHRVIPRCRNVIITHDRTCLQGRAGVVIGGHRGGKEGPIRLDTEAAAVPAGGDGVRGKRKLAGGAGGRPTDGSGEGDEAAEGAVRSSETRRGRFGSAERLR